jgi:HTH-type transcriptional regulator / antitoxin HigA
MKVIRDGPSYASALARVDELMVLDPDPTSPEGEELEVLSILIEDYERREHRIGAPSPLEAIEFRMEQVGLTQRDLVPFIGSKSKTSEVLSGRRPLSLPMVRALSSGLGIPAEVLIQETSSGSGQPYDPSRFPTRELVSRGWFRDAPVDSIGQRIVSLLNSFGGDEFLIAARTSAHVRSGREMDTHALMAWTAWAIHEAEASPPAKEFRPGGVNESLLSRVVKLSPAGSGPLDARDFLGQHGIALVVAQHLPKTYIDGALIYGSFPIIALTLRHDRLDSFWFTLLHELAHLLQACRAPQSESFFDDLEVESEDELELEADAVAGEILVPQSEWIASPASKLRSPEAVLHLASRLGVHPAIVAGRIRHDSGDYRKLSRMVGQGRVRHLFTSRAAE